MDGTCSCSPTTTPTPSITGFSWPTSSPTMNNPCIIVEPDGFLGLCPTEGPSSFGTVSVQSSTTLTSTGTTSSTTTTSSHSKTTVSTTHHSSSRKSTTTTSWTMSASSSSSSPSFSSSILPVSPTSSPSPTPIPLHSIGGPHAIISPVPAAKSQGTVNAAKTPGWVYAVAALASVAVLLLCVACIRLRRVWRNRRRSRGAGSSSYSASDGLLAGRRGSPTFTDFSLLRRPPGIPASPSTRSLILHNNNVLPTRDRSHSAASENASMVFGLDDEVPLQPSRASSTHMPRLSTELGIGVSDPFSDSFPAYGFQYGSRQEEVPLPPYTKDDSDTDGSPTWGPLSPPYREQPPLPPIPPMPQRTLRHTTPVKRVTNRASSTIAASTIAASTIAGSTISAGNPPSYRTQEA